MLSVCDRQTRVVATLTAVHGDLTRQDTDAIVNPTNAAVRGGGGLDAAIHAAGGPAILQECITHFPAGLATGDAGCTTAGNLTPRWVIHTVGPNYGGGQRDPAQLHSCYRRALHVADAIGARSIAFPLIGAGAHGWPRHAALEAAIDTILGTPSQVELVRLVVLDEEGYRQTRAALLLRCPPPVAPGTVGALFERQPLQFGLRGDAYLWRELRARFASTSLPSDWYKLRRLIVDAVGKVIDDPHKPQDSIGWHDNAEVVYIPAFDPGDGMSAGAVHVPWWSHTGIPILLDRFEAQHGPEDGSRDD